MGLGSRQLEIDDLMSRATFGNLLKGAKSAQRALERAGKKAPSFLVITEAGQTNVYDQQAAVNLADFFAQQLGCTAIVVQLVAISTKGEPKPAQTGEPPDGRTA